MNDTKWDEVRLAMYELRDRSPWFRTKFVDRDEPSRWDREWYYCYRDYPYRDTEWVDLWLIAESDRDAARDRLRAVRVPGVETDVGFRLYGWVAAAQAIDYVR